MGRCKPATLLPTAARPSPAGSAAPPPPRSRTGSGTGSGLAGAAALGRPLLAPAGAAGTLCSRRGGNRTQRFDLFFYSFPVLKSDLGFFLGSSVRPFCRWKGSTFPPLFHLGRASVGARREAHPHFSGARFAFRPPSSFFRSANC